MDGQNDECALLFPFKDFPVPAQHLTDGIDGEGVLLRAPQHDVLVLIHGVVPMQKATAIVLDEGDVTDADRPTLSVKEHALDAYLTADVVVFRGQLIKCRYDAIRREGQGAHA